MNMFREMRRFKQEFSKEECIGILQEAKRATLSVIGDDGYPYGVPVNFVYDEEDGKIYIHGAGEGHKTDSIKKCDKVSFTVVKEVKKDEESWFYHVDSVIVFGRAALIDDPDIVYKKTEKLGLKYIPTKEECDRTLEKYAHEVTLISIEIEHMSGKHVKEK